MTDWGEAVCREIERFQQWSSRDEFCVEALFTQAKPRLQSQFPTSSTHRQSMRRALQDLTSIGAIERLRPGDYRIVDLETDGLALQSVSKEGESLLEQWQAVAEEQPQGEHFDFVDPYDFDGFQTNVEAFISSPDLETFKAVRDHLNSGVSTDSGSNIYEKWTETKGREPEELATLIGEIQDASSYDTGWEDELDAKWMVRELYGRFHIDEAPPINSQTLAGLELFGYPSTDDYNEAHVHYEDFKLDYLEFCGHATEETDHEVSLNIEIGQLLRVITEVDKDGLEEFEGPAQVELLLESITDQRRMATPAMIGPKPRELGLKYVLGEIASRYPAKEEISGSEAERSVSNYPRLQGWLKSEATAAIKEFVAETDLDYKIRAGMGQGTMAYDPYVAVFDKNHTTSTQNGIYVVFLFDPAADSVFLTLNQGAQEATKASHCAESGANTYDLLDRAAESYREALATVPDRFTAQSPELTNDTSKARKYGRGAICYREYGETAFKQSSEDTTGEDLQNIISTYQQLLKTVGSTPTMTMPAGQMWRIGPGSGGGLWEVWSECGIASVGFGGHELADVQSASQDVRENWQKNQSEQQLYDFVTNIEDGDLIVAGSQKDNLSRVYGFGVVTAGFDSTDQDAVLDEYNGDIEMPHDRFIQVDWFPVAEQGLPITITYNQEVFNQWTLETLSEEAYQQIGAATCRKRSFVDTDRTYQEIADALHTTLGLSDGETKTTEKKTKSGQRRLPSLPDIDNPATAPYYWVNQSEGKAPVADKYLQAGLDERWSHNLGKLEVGDTVFNYHDGELLGYSVVASEAYVTEVDGAYKQQIDVTFTQFKEPIGLTDLYPIFIQDKYRLEKYNPMGPSGPNQEYLYCVSESAGEKLMQLGTAQQNIDRLEDRLSLPPVEPDLPEGLYYPSEQAVSIRNQIRAALNGGKHIVFTGPPGTGKSKLATAVCAQLTEAGVIDGSVFTTATAEWTAYDTVGGYMPSQNEKDGSLKFSPGQFLRCFRTDEGDIRTRWLVIDELNRSNIDKAFGQLFSVLSGDSVELPYERDDTVKIDWVDDGTLQEQREAIATNPDRYPVTPQWRLLGTMNTADKASLYEMSYAFMRRFAFIHVGIPELIEDGDVQAWLLNPAAGKDNYATSWLAIDPTTELDIEEDVDDDSVGLARTLDNIGDRIAVLWANINAGHEIGPALIEDLVSYTAAYDSEAAGSALTSAVISLVYPQLEGLRPDEQKDLINSLNDSTTIQWVHSDHEPEDTEAGVEDEGQVDNDREVTPGVDIGALKATAEDMFAIDFDDKDDA
ncbi:DUF3578 domain-containing protein [Halomicroarcula sp. F13]|uniref:DUF3578 domain-containing protein n=1 Tax=Haloarcula rubra TaxID=2487747 RepID=A0AAW4PRH9_9EURY|nr:DUF3578 domain-containing protein [Halomicroarcula rubra]MBX0322932.1 DUF3578 domain-containing protein [Halomicroarcula rubra]